LELRLRYTVDTNVLVHWLLNSESLAAKIIRSFQLDLFIPQKAVEELWKHRDLWSHKNPEVDLQDFVDSIGFFIEIIPSSVFDKRLLESANLAMKKIDPDDVDFVVVALMEQTDLWSYNKHFDKIRLPIKRVDTLDLLKMSPENLPLFELLKDDWTKNFE
jgi:predicted nucleic acid-binding protein